MIKDIEIAVTYTANRNQLEALHNENHIYKYARR